ncbi:hypothetical protein D3C80_981960 [compost metagenome]
MTFDLECGLLAGITPIQHVFLLRVLAPDRRGVEFAVDGVWPSGVGVGAVGACDREINLQRGAFRAIGNAMAQYTITDVGL